MISAYEGLAVANTSTKLRYIETVTAAERAYPITFTLFLAPRSPKI